MFYAGDELYDDEVTSGPIPDDDFDAERQAIEDEYDREPEDLQESYRYAARGGRGQ